MKTRNLLIILVALLAVLGILQLTQKRGKSKVLSRELVAFDTAKVDKVQIISPEGSLTLQKMGNQWEVSLPQGSHKKAENNKIKGLLSSLGSIKPGRLAARKEKEWNNYNVDSTGTRVQVYEEGKLATDLVVGRFGMEGQRSYYTFVRPFEEENVYVANGFMGVSIGKNAADYRNSQVIRLERDSLTQIAFDYPDSSFVLAKGEKWYLQNAVADSAAVEKYLRSLGYVNSKNLYDGEWTLPATHTITFSFSNAPDIMIEAYFQEGKSLIKSTVNSDEIFDDEALISKLFKSKSAFQTSD